MTALRSGSRGPCRPHMLDLTISKVRTRKMDKILEKRDLPKLTQADIKL